MLSLVFFLCLIVRIPNIIGCFVFCLDDVYILAEYMNHGLFFIVG